MENYKVLIKPSAVKELKKIPKKDLSRLTSRIESLALDPRPSGCEKLAVQNAFRIRQGDYRIIYIIEDAIFVVTVIKVGHRGDIYKS